jgi:hypothetical protein
LTGLTTALAVNYGGTGTTNLTGYVKGNNTAAFSATTTIPAADISGTLAISQGGTGQVTADLARTSLVAAKSGANTDITSLTGLTTALSVTQGGTGGNTQLAARTGIGAAALGVATASGLTTALGARLLGRANAAAGALEEITLGTGLSFSGTTLNAAASSGGTVNVTSAPFNADPTGLASSSGAFQAAIDSLSPLGGVVIVPPGKYLLSSSITVGGAGNDRPVVLQGSYINAGNVGATNAQSAMSSLRVAPTATINISPGCGVDGCMIYRSDLVFTTGSPIFTAGSVGITIGVGYDMFVRNCGIYGFAQGIKADNGTNSTGRVKITDVNIDCANGVLLHSSVDVAYLTRVHCWPFINRFAGSTANTTGLHRAGSAFRFTGTNDWTKATDCFSYGYARGFDIVGGDEITLTGCGADGTAVFSGSVGFLLTGATNTTMSHCQAAGQTNGFYIESGAAVSTRMVHCDAWGNTSNGIAHLNGHLAIFGGGLRGNATGIAVVSGASCRVSGLGLQGNATPTSGTLTAMPVTYNF